MLMSRRDLSDPASGRAAPQCVPAEPWSQEGPGTRGPKEAHTLAAEAFQRSFGGGDFGRAVTGFTPAADTGVVLTLLAHARPQRVLEIGTAAGHMTANLTEWSPEDAQVFSLGVVRDLNVPTSPEQQHDDPPRSEFARLANQFGR